VAGEAAGGVVVEAELASRRWAEYAAVGGVDPPIRAIAGEAGRRIAQLAPLKQLKAQQA
jgi:hypothetical protein